MFRLESDGTLIYFKGIQDNWPRGYKTFCMLNSAEHEILNVHKYKNFKKFSSDKPRMLFIHKCSNTNNYWHFNIYEKEKFHAHPS